MSITVEIPVHGNAKNKNTGRIDNPHYQERPCVFVKLTYGDITRTGDKISVDVSCVLQKCKRNSVYVSDNYIDPNDNKNTFVGYSYYRLDVYAQLGDGDVVKLFYKPGSNRSGQQMDGLPSGREDATTPDQWETGEYQGTATLEEINTSTQTTLKLFVAWGCHNCGKRGTLQQQYSVNLTAPRTLNNYTISYNANGGSNPPASQTKIENTDLALRSTAPTAPQANIALDPEGGVCSNSRVTGTRRCLGWNTKADGSGVSYSLGAVYSENANATMYANWGGYILPRLPDCTRENCEFAGWYVGDKRYSEGDILPYSSSPKLTARYGYIVRYDANGGTGAPSQQIKTHGQNLTLSTASPTRTGYTFLGWSDSPDAATSTYSSGGTYSADSPVTLYAVWGQNTFSVRYDYAGGVDAQGRSSSTVTVAYGQDATPPTVWRDGYYFDGWSSSSTDITANKTIVARWQRSRLHTMTNQDNWTGKTNSQEIIYEYRGGKWVKCLKLHSYDGKDWGDVK